MPAMTTTVGLTSGRPLARADLQDLPGRAVGLPAALWG